MTKLDTSDKLSIIAIIISCGSLILSLISQMNTNYYAKEINNQKLDIIFTDHNDPTFYGIVFVNVGKGPASITDVLLILPDGRATPASPRGWNAILKDIGVKDPSLIRTVSFTGGGYIAAESRLRVVGALKDELTPELKKEIDKFYNGLLLAICYKSNFGDNFYAASPGVEGDVCAKLKLH